MPLSLSTRAAAITPSLTLAIDSRAKQLKAEGVDVIGLGAGEPDYDTPGYICDAAKYAIDAGMTRYTPVAGTLELRRRICEKLKADNGLTYAPDEIIVSSGAKQSLYTAICAIVNEGDEVLIPAPCWVSYPEMVKMAGGVPVLVYGKESEEFIVTADMLKPFVTERTKALIINSPNNPTGNILNRKRLTEIAKLAVDSGFYVISDEIYEKLIYDGNEHVSIASLGEDIKAQTILVNGVSKTYAMTGWRIGYAAGPKRVIKAMSSFQSHAASNPNSIAQHAASVALAQGHDIVASMVSEFEARRDLMHDMANAIPGVSANLPHGAFYMMLKVSDLFGSAFDGEVIDSTDKFCAVLLDKKHVAVVPGSAFSDPEHVRMSYATSRSNISEAMTRIAAFVAELSKA